MNTNDQNTALYEKMAAEQDKYRDWLKSQPPAEVLNHACEYTIREDILMRMEELELTDAQAQALLDSGIDIDKVLDIEVPDEKITKRMSGRRVCSKCANSYHIEYKKPAKEGICDACGGELVQRKDDAPETVLARLAEYHQMTEPLKDFYDKLGKLVVVEGQEEVAQTTALVYAALED